MADGELRQLEAAAKERPDSVEAQAEWAFGLQEAGRDDEALAAFERAVALAPRDADLLLAAAESAKRCDRRRRTAALVEQALEVAPHRPEAYAAAARLLSTETNATDRLLAAAQYLRLAPGAPDRGEIKVILDVVLDKITQDAGTGVETERLQEYQAALAHLAGVADGLRLEAVDAALRRALAASRPEPRAEAAPPDFAATLAEADAGLTAGDWPAAVRRYQSAALLAEDGDQRFAALMGEARARLVGGSFSAARSAVTEAADLDPTSPEPRLLEAEIAVAQGDWDAALEAYQMAEAADPIDLRVQRGLGTTLVALKRWDEARDPLQKVLADQPDDVEACRLLGTCYREAGLPRYAAACFEELLRLDPGCRDAAELERYVAMANAEPEPVAAATPAADTGDEDDEEDAARRELQSTVRDRVLKRRDTIPEPVDPALQVRCRVCRTLNAPGQAHCSRCGSPLALKEEVSGKAKKGGCFVATAACGVDAPEVVALRAYREQVLRPTAAGRLFIRAYERLSPPLAEFIAGRPACRAAVRRHLIAPLAARAAARCDRPSGDAP